MLAGLNLSYNDSLFFLYTEDISAIFLSLSNIQLFLFWLKHCVTTGAITSGILPFDIAFLLFILLAKYYQNILFAKYLHDFCNFLIALSVGSVSPIV